VHRQTRAAQACTGRHVRHRRAQADTCGTGVHRQTRAAQACTGKADTCGTGVHRQTRAAQACTGRHVRHRRTQADTCGTGVHRQTRAAQAYTGRQILPATDLARCQRGSTVRLRQAARYVSARQLGTSRRGSTIRLSQTARYVSGKKHGTSQPGSIVHLSQAARYVAARQHGTCVPGSAVCLSQAARYVSARQHGASRPGSMRGSVVFGKQLDDEAASMYKDKFLQYLRMAEDDELFFFKANCSAEIKNCRYIVDVSLTLKVTTQESQCNCGAGMAPHGHLKHVACVLQALIEFQREGYILAEETCTQKAQSFHSSKKYANSPVKYEQLKLKRVVYLQLF